MSVSPILWLVLFVLVAVVPLMLLGGDALAGKSASGAARRGASWTRLAAHVGLTPVGDHQMDGVIDGVRVRVDKAVGSMLSDPLAVVGLDITAWGAEAVPLVAEASAGMERQPVGLPTGDPRLDRVVAIHGPEALVRAVLDPAARRALGEVARLGGGVRNGTVSARLEVDRLNVGDLRPVVEAATALARALVPPSDVLGRLIHHATHDEEAGVRAECAEAALAHIDEDQRAYALAWELVRDEWADFAVRRIALGLVERRDPERYARVAPTLYIDPLLGAEVLHRALDAGVDPGVHALHEILEFGPSGARQHALRHALRHGHGGFEAAAIANLALTDPALATAAADYLAYHGTRHSLGPLSAAAHSPHREARDAARIARQKVVDREGDIEPGGLSIAGDARGGLSIEAPTRGALSATRRHDER